MRTRVWKCVVGVTVLAAAVPAVVFAAAAPASASPLGYTLIVEGGLVEPGANSASSSTTPTSDDVEAQQAFFTCTLATIDLGSGTVSPLSTTSEESCVDDLTETPDGRVFGIQQQCDGELCTFLPFGGASNGPSGFGDVGAEQIDETVHLIEFNPATGAPTDLGQISGEALLGFGLPSPISEGGITSDKNGALYVEMIGVDDECDFDAFCLYRVDPADPENAAFIGTGPDETFYEILAAGCGTPEAVTLETEPIGDASMDAPGGLAFPGVSNPELFSRDLATADTADIGPVGEFTVIDGMAFDSNGVLWGVGFEANDSNTQTVYTINTSTGAATPSTDIDVEALLVGLAIPLDCPAAAPLVVLFTG